VAILLPDYTAALRLFDPRWDMAGMVVWPKNEGPGPVEHRGVNDEG
jgi:hypothetical protein